MAETLRGNLSDTINELNKLLLLSVTEEEDTRLRQLRRVYKNLWEETILKDLQANSAELQPAIASLQEARQAAVEAVQDSQKVAGAIDKAVKAAKAVDKIVQTGMGLLA